MNYTSTINIPNSHVDFNYDKSSDISWGEQHSIHYAKNVKHIHNDIQSKVEQIAREQSVRYSDDTCKGTVNILWNKCRYFELSYYTGDILRFVSQSAKVKIQYGDMLVSGRLKLEAVVKAFNKKGIHCKITQDWI